MFKQKSFTFINKNLVAFEIFSLSNYNVSIFCLEYLYFLRVKDSIFSEEKQHFSNIFPIINLTQSNNCKNRYNLRFLFSSNPIKIRYSNTVFYIYFRNLVWNWVMFSSTALELSSICYKKCLILAQYWKIFLNFTISF